MYFCLHGVSPHPLKELGKLFVYLKSSGTNYMSWRPQVQPVDITSILKPNEVTEKCQRSTVMIRPTAQQDEVLLFPPLLLVLKQPHILVAILALEKCVCGEGQDWSFFSS